MNKNKSDKSNFMSAMIFVEYLLIIQGLMGVRFDTLMFRHKPGMSMILYDTPFTFPNLLRDGVTFTILTSGVDCKIFRREALENGTKGAVLENFNNLLEFFYK